MALDLQRMRNQYDTLLKQTPLSVTYNSVEYRNCARTSVTLDRLWLDEGRLASYEFSVIASQALIAAEPAIDETVKINGTTYRILGISTDGPGIGKRLDLGSEYAQ